MPRATETFRNAQILAEFANLNLKDARKVDYFRHNYPDFFPRKWWEHALGEQTWVTQRLLRHSWTNYFGGGAFALVRLLSSVFDPDELIEAQLGIKANRVFAAPDMLPWGDCPFHDAVIHLFDDPWRARFCAECKKRFIAAEPKNKFCSSLCSEENRRRQKREWFQRYGKAWRRKRRKA